MAIMICVMLLGCTDKIQTLGTFRFRSTNQMDATLWTAADFLRIVIAFVCALPSELQSHLSRRHRRSGFRLVLTLCASEPLSINPTAASLAAHGHPGSARIQAFREECFSLMYRASSMTSCNSPLGTGGDGSGFRSSNRVSVPC